MYADEDIKRYELEQKQNQELIRQVNAALDEMHIEYEFPFLLNPEKELYFSALEEFSKMLSGAEPLSLKYAVYLAENAYDPSINWDEFNFQIQQAVSVVGLDMKNNKTSADDNTAKIMSTFRYMADTITAYMPSKEKQITSYPKAYDFEDFWGRHDYRKMFVSKLLSKGSGQCHSMPLLFLILCEEIGADAYLSFAPNHSFVKFKDKRGNWHNLELTNGMLASDHFMVESGYVKAEAIQSRIYLEPITKQQTIVQCLNDLALGYVKKFGYDPFVKKCIDLALRYDANSLTARQIDANYYATLAEYILYQYRIKGIGKDHLKTDKEALAIFEAAKEATMYVDNLGYADMPAEAYEAWLNSIQKEANKQQHTREVKLLGGLIER